MPTDKKRKRKAKRSRSDEVAELRQRLAEARQHRDLLINTVHRLAGLVAAAPAVGGAAADLETIEDWLISDIERLTLTRPVRKSGKLSDLKVPLDPLTKDVNDRWFPNGGGFASIDGSTLVGNLAYAIWKRLNP
jgi:hypothetical protein